jgi:hypothetical protein
MQLKNFLFENGSFVVFVAFSLSLFVWVLSLIFLFDYVDYGVYKPAYVGAGWLFALAAGFFLLVTSVVFSFFKVKTPKVFAVAGLLLILINVYDAASIIIYVHTTSLEDNLPITTLKRAELQNIVSDNGDGIYFIGTLDTRDGISENRLYSLNNSFNDISEIYGVDIKTAVLPAEIFERDSATRKALHDLGVTNLPAVVVIEGGKVEHVFTGLDIVYSTQKYLEGSDE